MLSTDWIAAADTLANRYKVLNEIPWRRSTDGRLNAERSTCRRRGTSAERIGGDYRMSRRSAERGIRGSGGRPRVMLSWMSGRTDGRMGKWASGMSGPRDVGKAECRDGRKRKVEDGGSTV